MNIRRFYAPGQIVFITQVVKDRKRLFDDESMVALLRRVLNNVHDHHPFSMIAYVFLPDHFHLLIQTNEKANFSQIMHSLKRNFTMTYKQEKGIDGSVSFWQSRFWDHVIRNEEDFENHFHYIHMNPINHGYTEKLKDWKHSSYHDWYQRGVYDGWEGWQEPEDAAWGE